MPPRKRKPTKQAPLPTFNLTVEELAKAPTVLEKQDIYRKVNLKMTREIAQAFVDEVKKQLAESSVGWVMIEVDGRVT